MKNKTLGKTNKKIEKVAHNLTETKIARENVGLWGYLSISYVAWLIVGGEMWR